MSACEMAGGFNNLLFCADSYKTTHYKQYPPNTTSVYSYFESRGGKHQQILFFGLQYIIKRWLVGEVVTREKVEEARHLYNLHFGQEVFNEEGWMYIVEKHKGRLPVRIRAVPEGRVLPQKNVLFTIENTDPHCYWLTNYLETLLVQTWYPTTVATNSFHHKLLLQHHNHLTLDHDDHQAIDLLTDFQLHDFGYRASTSVESASIGGLAHLVNFKGTDNVAALLSARAYYKCDLAGLSIPASEHSTMTTWGRQGEEEAFRHMLQSFSEGAVSVVSDSYDVFNACRRLWGGSLREEVVRRGEKGGRVVIRPDSGDPKETLLKVLDILAENFPCHTNSKGFKVLPVYLRVLQGDGVNLESLKGVLEALRGAAWSGENVVFGSGGALLQTLNRDTLKFALKCSYAVVDGQSRNVYKDPVGDHGKRSKSGRLKLLQRPDGSYHTQQECSPDDDDTDDLLEVVYEDGELLREWSLEEVRERAKKALKDALRLQGGEAV